MLNTVTPSRNTYSNITCQCPQCQYERDALTLPSYRLNTTTYSDGEVWQETYTMNSETGEKRTYCWPVTRDRDAIAWKEVHTINKKTLEQKTYYYPVSRQGTTVSAR